MFGKWARRVHFPSSLHCPSRALPWVACVTGRTQGTGGRDTRAGSPSEWLLASPAPELPGGGVGSRPQQEGRVIAGPQSLLRPGQSIFSGRDRDRFTSRWTGKAGESLRSAQPFSAFAASVVCIACIRITLVLACITAVLPFAQPSLPPLRTRWDGACGAAEIGAARAGRTIEAGHWVPSRDTAAGQQTAVARGSGQWRIGSRPRSGPATHCNGNNYHSWDFSAVAGTAGAAEGDRVIPLPAEGGSPPAGRAATSR